MSSLTSVPSGQAVRHAPTELQADPPGLADGNQAIEAVVVDPASFSKEGAAVFSLITQQSADSPRFSAADFEINREWLRPVVVGALRGRSEDLAFYKEHRLFNLDGAPGWALEHLETDARAAIRVAHAAFEQLAERRKASGHSNPRTVSNARAIADSVEKPLQALGLGKICCFKEVEATLDFCQAIKRQFDPGKQCGKFFVSGSFQLNDTTAFGTRAQASFRNRAQHMLVAYLLDDFAHGVAGSFALEHKVLYEIFKQNDTLEKLSKDRRVINLANYAQFFYHHPEIPHERRQRFVEQNYQERLAELAIAVEFHDLVPQLLPPAPVVTQAVSPIAVSTEPTLLDQETIGVTHSHDRLAQLVLLSLPEDSKADATELTRSLRALIRAECADFFAVCEALKAGTSAKVLLATIRRQAEFASQSESPSPQVPIQSGGYALRFFTRSDGERCPFKSWFDALDPHIRTRIEDRLRLAADQGHLGDTKPFTHHPGIFEFRIKGDQRVLFSYGPNRSLVIWTGTIHDRIDKVLETVESWRDHGGTAAAKSLEIPKQ
jgi:hypothetical protein